jgi:hypothetical protein
MVVDELTDGARIGRLLSSEVHGHERGALGRLAVVDADEDATPSESGTFAFAIARDGAEQASGAERDDRLAEVYLQPDRVRVELPVAPDRAANAAGSGDFEIRQEATAPPRSSIFVESGAEVKTALRVLERIAEQVLDESG